MNEAFDELRTAIGDVARAVRNEIPLDDLTLLRYLMYGLLALSLALFFVLITYAATDLMYLPFAFGGFAASVIVLLAVLRMP